MRSTYGWRMPTTKVRYPEVVLIPDHDSASTTEELRGLGCLGKT